MPLQRVDWGIIFLSDAPEVGKSHTFLNTGVHYVEERGYATGAFQTPYGILLERSSLVDIIAIGKEAEIAQNVSLLQTSLQVKSTRHGTTPSIERARQSDAWMNVVLCTNCGLDPIESYKISRQKIGEAYRNTPKPAGQNPPSLYYEGALVFSPAWVKPEDVKPLKFVTIPVIGEVETFSDTYMIFKSINEERATRTIPGIIGREDENSYRAIQAIIETETNAKDIDTITKTAATKETVQERCRFFKENAYPWYQRVGELVKTYEPNLETAMTEAFNRPVKKWFKRQGIDAEIETDEKGGGFKVNGQYCESVGRFFKPENGTLFTAFIAPEGLFRKGIIGWKLKGGEGGYGGEKFEPGYLAICGISIPVMNGCFPLEVLEGSTQVLVARAETL